MTVTPAQPFITLLNVTAFCCSAARPDFAFIVACNRRGSGGHTHTRTHTHTHTHTNICEETDKRTQQLSCSNILLHSLAYSLTDSRTQSLTDARTHAHTDSLTHLPPTHSLTHSLTHARTHSRTHLLTHSLAHSLTHIPATSGLMFASCTGTAEGRPSAAAMFSTAWLRLDMRLVQGLRAH